MIKVEQAVHCVRKYDHILVGVSGATDGEPRTACPAAVVVAASHETRGQCYSSTTGRRGTMYSGGCTEDGWHGQEKRRGDGTGLLARTALLKNCKHAAAQHQRHQGY